MAQNNNKNSCFGYLSILIIFAIFFVLLISCNKNIDNKANNTKISTEVTTSIETNTESTTIIITKTITQAIESTTNLTDNNTNSVNTQTVYIGKTGAKYHKQNCSTLKGNGIAITLDKALDENREPCKRCKP